MNKRPSDKTPLFPFARNLCGRRGASGLKGYTAAQQTLHDRGLPGVQAVLSRLIDPGLFAPEQSGHFSRQRNYDFATTVHAMLWQSLSGQSACRDAVLQVQALRCKNQREMIPAETSAYCMARSKLPLGRLEQIRRALSERLSDQVDKDWAGLAAAGWGGREVLIIDGSSVQVEDTPANVAAYGYPAGVRPSCGFPTAGLAALFNLRTGGWVGHRLGSHRVSDVKLGLPLLREHVQPEQIVLGDRAYSSYWMFAWLRAQGAAGVFRISDSRRADFRRGQRLGKNERLMIWRKPKRDKACPLSEAEYEQLPADLFVRVLRVRLPAKGQRTRHVLVATTLSARDAFPLEQLLELYHGRWQVEMRLAELKTALGMDPLRCKSPGMVERAIAVYACAYNLVRALMLESAQRENVPLARLSFKGTTDALCAWMSTHPAAGALGRSGGLAWWTRLLDVIGHDLIPQRPNRHEPRVLKRRPKDFQNLTRPRRQMKVTRTRGYKPVKSPKTPR